MVRAADQEVVAQREHDVHIRLGGESPQERGEPLLDLRQVQCEQLLELVHDQRRLRVV